MVAKEIDVGMLACNLVRAVTYLAAQTAALTPRSFGLTRVRNVINAFTPVIAAAKSEEEARKLFDKMMYYVGQAKLPRRTRKRPSCPRAVWGKPQTFPKRSGLTMQRVALNSSLLQSAGYQDQLTLLELAFRDGAVYITSLFPRRRFRNCCGRHHEF